VGVVTLQTQDGTLKRLVVKLCLLPILQDKISSESDVYDSQDVEMI